MVGTGCEHGAVAPGVKTGRTSTGYCRNIIVIFNKALIVVFNKKEEQKEIKKNIRMTEAK